MSSSDTPLLSGTNFQTKSAASTLKPPYSQYAKPWLKAAVSADYKWMRGEMTKE